MTDREFGDWASAHVAATGADPSRLTELLWANRHSIVSRLTATYAELCECTQRLFEGARVPEYPSEHPNAIVRELKALRAELARDESTRRNVTPLNGIIQGCDCPNCNGGELLPSYAAALDRLHDYIRRHGSLTGGIGMGGF